MERDETPSGLPPDGEEQAPLGTEDDEAATEGTEAMPGIPEEDEPDISG